MAGDAFSEAAYRALAAARPVPAAAVLYAVYGHTPARRTRSGSPRRAGRR